MKKYVDVIGEEIRDLVIGDKLEINNKEVFDVVDLSVGKIKVNKFYDDDGISEISITRFIEGTSKAVEIRKIIEVEEKQKVKVDEWLYEELGKYTGINKNLRLVEILKAVYFEGEEEKYHIQLLVDCITNGYELECQFKEGDIIKSSTGHLYSYKDGFIDDIYTLVCKVENREDN